MSESTRKVVANITLSLDGRTNGPGGDSDMGWIVPHAITEGAREGMTSMYTGATTALLGRKNYQGFGGFWPAVATDDNAHPADRAFSAWLNETEKVVFSTTMNDAPWENSRIVNDDPATVVKELRQQPGGNIAVLSSSSLIKALLEADEVDRLSINLAPELVGGGARLFPDGLPASSWTLSGHSRSDSGALWLFYDRVR